MKTFRSLSFRLAMIYLAFFVGSAAALGGLYYWLEMARPLGDVRDGISAEAGPLAQIHRAQGEEALALALERRAGEASPRLAYHALIDPAGHVVTANLPSWPANFVPGWKHLEADVALDGDEDEHEALVLDLRLDDGSRLLIGRDVEDVDELEDSLRAALVWFVPSLLVLGALGAALLSRTIGGRIDAISGAARAVIDGEFSSRIKLHGSDDDFDRLAATLNHMLDRLEGSLEAVRRVSDSVAHELRTPLARLQATLADLHDRSGAEEAADALDEALRLGKVIDAVLRISRIEAARHEIALEPVDLSALLQDAAEFYFPEAEARSQRLAVEIAPGLRIAGDRDLLFQGIANLVDNAVKFTPEGGTVTLAAGPAGSGVVIEISDDGPGIAPELLDQVTERFFRGPDADKVPGFGLGLSLVAAVAAAHRSTLEFISEGRGLTVRWRL